MRIDGRTIAEKILTDLASQVAALKQKGVVPTLAVIQVGDDPGSTAYINQKRKAAEAMGATLIHNHQPSTINHQQLQALIAQYNADPLVHGLIVQQPLPKSLGDVSKIIDTIAPQKDVDGFLPNSPFDVPVANAVVELLRNIKYQKSNIKNEELKEKEFLEWLQAKTIAVIGRGETAGKPIAGHLRKLGCSPAVVHSQTVNPDDVIRSADIVISCVGKSRVVTENNLKPGSILIGVGIWRDSVGKLHGDYEEEEIKDIASAYTPTPGGVGPVNVACLMQNLVKATQNRVYLSSWHKP